jgi:hypothetical protein
MLGIRLYKIHVAGVYVIMSLDCYYCGYEKIIKITKSDMMESYFKRYLERNEIEHEKYKLQLFLLGLYHRSLFDSETYFQDYKIFVLEMLNRFKNKVIVRRGKKIKIASFNIEKYLK